MGQASRGCGRTRLGYGVVRSVIFVTVTAQLALCGSVLVAGKVKAQSQTQTVASLPSGSQLPASRDDAQPTFAWTKFCEQRPEECAIDPSEPASISLTPAAWGTIVSVNARVNAAIKPMTDYQHWNVEDRWDYPDDGYGDCEDYQMLKRKLLVEADLPRRALRMTVVIDEDRAGHAVLMVRTDRGDFVLDNKRDAVLSWTETGYTYIKREGTDSAAWLSFGPQGSPVATANR